MTIKFTVVDSATGVTLRTGSTMTMATAMLQAGPGETVIPVGSDPAVEAVDPGTGATTIKPLMNVSGQVTQANKINILANGNDFISITNVPAGAQYFIEYPRNFGIADIPSGNVNDGVLEVTTTIKGAYKVTLVLGNFQNFSVNFNAN